jgi:hypothetical protein
VGSRIELSTKTATELLLALSSVENHQNIKYAPVPYGTFRDINFELEACAGTSHGYRGDEMNTLYSMTE